MTRSTGRPTPRRPISQMPEIGNRQSREQGIGFGFPGLY
jgi:hypothetical protein